MVKLTRISKSETSGNLRGEGVEGYAVRPPVVGEQFRVWSDRDDGSTRYVQTSLVTEVLPDGEFKTRTGSLYKIELL